MEIENKHKIHKRKINAFKKKKKGLKWQVLKQLAKKSETFGF